MKEVKDQQFEKPTRELSENGSVAEDGAIVDRQRLERKLLWKVDLRFSILVIIYILNVSVSAPSLPFCSSLDVERARARRNAS